MTAYALYEPVNTLKAIADNVWIVDGPEIQMTYPWLPFFKVPFPTRMTIVRLGDGGLWLHSPTPLTEALAAAVDALGRVTFLVAPNLLHFWWIADWKARYPQACAYAAPGTRKHAEKRFTGFDADLTDAPPSEWQGEFVQVLVPGSYMTEAVFLHKASRTLILTDLIENFEPDRFSKTWLRWACQWAGCCDPDGRAPDRPALDLFAPPRFGARGGADYAGMAAGACDSGAWQVVSPKRRSRVETRLPLGFMSGRVIPKKLVPDAIGDGYRVSEKITRQRKW